MSCRRSDAQYHLHSNVRMMLHSRVFIMRDILTVDASLEVDIYQSEHNNMIYWFNIINIVYKYYFNLEQS